MLARLCSEIRNELISFSCSFYSILCENFGTVEHMCIAGCFAVGACHPVGFYLLNFPLRYSGTFSLREGFSLLQRSHFGLLWSIDFSWVTWMVSDVLGACYFSVFPLLFMSLHKYLNMPSSFQISFSRLGDFYTELGPALPCPTYNLSPSHITVASLR